MLRYSESVSVIDGSTNTVVDEIEVGTEPYGIVVNPNTNKIYIVNSGSGSVSVLNGATNTVIMVEINMGSQPYALAVNSRTNKIYVADYGTSCVAVINGSLNKAVSKICILVGSSLHLQTLKYLRNLKQTSNKGDQVNRRVCAFYRVGLLLSIQRIE